MKILAVARKTLKEYWREPLLLGILLAFPIMLLAVYAIAFKDSDAGLASYLTILVENHDQGEQGDALIEALRAAEYEDLALFEVVPVERTDYARISLREHKAALLLVLPADLTERIQAAAPANVQMVGDPYSDSYVFARGLVKGVLDEVIAGRPAETWPVTYEFLSGTGTLSDFDFGVPGLIVFGIMFVSVTTAMTLVRENVSGTLQRLQTSSLSAAELLIGLSVAQMVVAAVQVPVTLGAAVLMGFQSNGSLLLALGIGLLLSLAAIALGLLTACFARSDGEAANLGAVLGVMTVLLSGAMYPMPSAPLFDWGGRTIQVYDFLPTTHASEALRRVLIYGAGVQEIGYHLVALAVLSVLLLGVGVLLYGRLRLRRV